MLLSDLLEDVAVAMALVPNNVEYGNPILDPSTYYSKHNDEVCYTCVAGMYVLYKHSLNIKNVKVSHFLSQEVEEEDPDIGGIETAIDHLRSGYTEVFLLAVDDVVPGFYHKYVNFNALTDFEGLRANNPTYIKAFISELKDLAKKAKTYEIQQGYAK